MIVDETEIQATRGTSEPWKTRKRRQPRGYLTEKELVERSPT